MPSGLLPTKLHFRRALRRKLVVRDRLARMLADALTVPLTIVQGPAGSGKSTAVAAFLAGCEHPVAWLSLDDDDDRNNRFFAYVLAALRTADPSLGAKAEVLLHAPPLQDLEGMLADEVVIPLAQRDTPIVLAIDDYHLIRDPRIHSALHWLIEHAPACLHLILMTRADPGLELARPRAHGELLELGPEHLYFDEQEAQQFYNETMTLGLGPEDVGRLQQATEGWPAGSQLAALSIRAEGSAWTPSGEDRVIANYLIDEVFDRQDPEMRSFLLASSVLDRFCAPLLTEVTERADAGPLLARAEAQGLFVISLDSHGRWFRFHHLFRELLRRRASEAIDLQTLHRRAAAWFAERDERDAAFHHALAAGDDERLADYFQRWLGPTLFENHTGRVQRWLDDTPARLLDEHPFFVFASAWCDIIVGHLQRGLVALDRAFDLASRPNAPPLAPAALPWFYGLGPMIRVAALLRLGNYNACLELSRTSRAAIPPEANKRRLVVAAYQMHEGMAELAMDQLEQAERSLQAAVDGFQSEAPEQLPLAFAHLAHAQRRRGQLEYAQYSARQAWACAEQTNQCELSNGAMAQVELAWLAHLAGQHEQACRGVEQAIERMRLLRDTAYLAHATELLARVKAAMGEVGEAVEVIDQSLAVLETGDMRPATRRMVLLRRELQNAPARPKLRPAQGLNCDEFADLPPIEALTPRELEVLQLVATGLANREIAGQLGVSSGTIKTHIQRILRKLSVGSRTRAVHRARASGII